MTKKDENTLLIVGLAAVGIFLYMRSKGQPISTPGAPLPVAAVQYPGSTEVVQLLPQPSPGATSVQSLTPTQSQIVAAKTGYPTAMPSGNFKPLSFTPLQLSNI